MGYGEPYYGHHDPSGIGQAVSMVIKFCGIVILLAFAAGVYIGYSWGRRDTQPLTPSVSAPSAYTGTAPSRSANAERTGSSSSQAPTRTGEGRFVTDQPIK